MTATLTEDQIRQLIATGDVETLLKLQQYMDLTDAKKCQESFKHFVQLFWNVTATSPLQPGWYLDALCDHLQHLRQIKKLLINIPPRHGKSTLCAVLFPAWVWCLRPHVKFLCSSYSLQLSERDSVYCRQVIESPLYQRLFSHKFKLLDDQNTKKRFENNKRGLRMATSVDSGNTGEGADVVIADDLNNVRDVTSKAYRQQVLDWWTQTMSTRMNPTGWQAQLVIQQRCHEEDVTGYIIANDHENQWTKLILPWEFDSKRATVTSRWQDPRTEDGQALSDLYSPARIKELKGPLALGPTGFATQFQQTPTAADGNLFKREWFGRYREDEQCYYLHDQKIPKDSCYKFATSDLAISTKTSADWTVIAVWAVTPHRNLLLLDLFRDRVEGPQSVKAFHRYNAMWKPETIVVEDVAFQRLMIQMLRQAGLPITSFSPHGQDKMARSQRAQAMAECGLVWVPTGKTWVDTFLDELAMFPNGRYDDCVDAFSVGAVHAAKRPVFEVPELMTPEKQQAEEERKRAEFMWRD